MTLRQARCSFSMNLVKLIEFARLMGYEIAFGEVVRSQAAADFNAAQGRGISNSLHLIGLAADLHLYRDGHYVADTEGHRLLGDYWKGMNPAHRWGGDFGKPDGNHYSFTWEGRA